jgi:hypothetical protein
MYFTFVRKKKESLSTSSEMEVFVGIGPRNQLPRLIKWLKISSPRHMFCDLTLAVKATCRNCMCIAARPWGKIGSACKKDRAQTGRRRRRRRPPTASRFEGSMIGWWLGALYWNAKYNEQIPVLLVGLIGRQRNQHFPYANAPSDLIAQPCSSNRYCDPKGLISASTSHLRLRLPGLGPVWFEVKFSHFYFLNNQTSWLK